MLTESEAPPALAPDARGMGTIRPFAASDADAVANLLVRAFQNSSRPAPTGMAAYLRHVYLDAPWVDPLFWSRVLESVDGRIVGFLGVTALPMAMASRRINAAVISSLAVDPVEGGAMTAARLLRDVRSGPQDAIVSDRCNAAAVAALRALGGEVIRAYSFDWLRTLRPLGFGLDALARRMPPLRLLAPLVSPFDNAALGRSLRTDGARWVTPSRARAAEAFTDRPAGLDEMTALLPELVADFALRPDWTPASLRALLGDASQKADLGDFAARLVLDTAQRPVGAFMLHLRKGRTAQVLQLLSRKGREGIVLDRAIASATAAGAVAIRGRSTPRFTEALMERRALFVPEQATVVLTRDAEILAHFRDGTAFFTGLAGEEWMRLNGDRF
ncbi:MAG: hypothetical protein ABI697_09690 [Devosia sp.]